MHSRVTQIYAKPQLSPEQLAALAKGLGTVVNACIDLLDAIAGDPDLETSNAEDEGLTGLALSRGGYGPGDETTDPGGGDVCDEPHDWNELELDEGAYGHTVPSRMDQSRPISADNPELV